MKKIIIFMASGIFAFIISFSVVLSINKQELKEVTISSEEMALEIIANNGEMPIGIVAEADVQSTDDTDEIKLDDVAEKETDNEEKVDDETDAAEDDLESAVETETEDTSSDREVLITYDFSFDDVKIMGIPISDCNADKVLEALGEDPNTIDIKNKDIGNGFELSVNELNYAVGDDSVLGKSIHISSGASNISYSYMEGYVNEIQISRYNASEPYADLSQYIEVPYSISDGDYREFFKSDEIAEKVKGVVSDISSSDDEKSTVTRYSFYSNLGETELSVYEYSGKYYETLTYIVGDGDVSIMGNKDPERVTYRYDVY